MSQRKAVLKKICSYLPENKLTSEQLAREFPDWDLKKILEMTGIHERSIAGNDECASDLGVVAANKLFNSGICLPEDIDFLLFCTQSPDYFLPTTACIMQHRLGLKNSCGALDYNLGCSGFVYGLSLAKGLIESDLADNVLLITAETYSKFINPTDRSVRTIFSDGAAAALITASYSQEELIGPFIFATDGKGAKDLMVPGGALRQPYNEASFVEKEVEKGVFRSPLNIYMNGPEIFNFTLKTVPKTVSELLDKSNKTVQDIDFFVFHQANKFMLERLRSKIKLPREKFLINLESYGNTVSSTIPMALEIAENKGIIKDGNTIMLVGFGVGYSWSAALIKIGG